MSLATGPGSQKAGRILAVVFWILAFNALVLYHTGRMTFDTKLGVNIDPLGFYARLWDLWNPLQWFGGIHNQYTGYAFPMLPFYALADLVGLPVWLAERVWMASVLTTGFWGFVRLAERLSLGDAVSRPVAGALFALWPTFTILIGSTSAAILPAMLAPWAVLHLANPDLSPRRAATRAGLIVLCMGGVNAVCTIAALVLPTLWVLFHRRWALLGWWVFSVGAATLWWVVPLLHQAEYGHDFLPYIETASDATSTMSAAAVLRGAGDWVAYLALGAPWLPAGWAMVSSVWTIGAASLTAAAGLFGLARSDLPERAWLRWSAGLAALIALAGYGGPLGGPLHPWVQQLLDGPLAPFRNVYKWEPVLATVLCLGVAHTLPLLRQRLTVAAVAPIVLAGVAIPYLTGQILQPGSFRVIPEHWHQTAAFLERHSPTNTALVVPANSHGLYAWGQPIDEPLEPLANSPWAQRDLVPFGGGGVRDLLDAAEKAISAGRATPGLAAYLTRAGVRYVVARNDLDPDQPDYTSPDLVRTALRESGYQRVTSFGPQERRAGSGIEYPAVEIYQAADPAYQPTTPVSVLAADDALRVSGGPSALLQLAAQGLVRPDQAVLTSGVDPDAPAAARIVTDGLRRTETRFKLVTRNVSHTYTATETTPVDDPYGRGGQPPLQLPPVPLKDNETVAVLSGAARVTASSYGSWFWSEPHREPVAAFDGDPATAWTEGRPEAGVGQWIQVEFDEPLDLPATVPIRLLQDVRRAMAVEIKATTDKGSVRTTLDATGDAQPLKVPAGPTKSLRLTLTRVDGHVSGGPGAGISEVELPGVQVVRGLRVPDVPSGKPVSYSFRRDTTAMVALLGNDAEPVLHRVFTSREPTAYRVAATAVAQPGAALDALLNTLRGAGKVSVTASSTLGSLPALRAENLLDGSEATAWVADDPRAELTLRWKGKRLIDRMVLKPGARGLASAPAQVEISGADGVRVLQVPADGRLFFTPLSTDHLKLTFTGVRERPVRNPLTGITGQPPVGLAELDIPALDTLLTDTSRQPEEFNLPCGQGPAVTVDGRAHPTSVSGTFASLVELKPLTVKLCTPGARLSLPAGTHKLDTSREGAFAVTDVSLTAPAPETSDKAVRDLTVHTWDTVDRRLTVGAGDTSYLRVHQAVNIGWKATLNGAALTPVTIDGWQQGFLLPEGEGGEIRLWFAPADRHHLLLGIAVAAALLVAVLALWPGGRAPGRPEPLYPGRTALPVFVLITAVGGWVGLAVPLLTRLPDRARPWIAFGAMALAGAFSAAGVAAGEIARHGVGAFGWPAQLAALVALAAALLPGRRK
ncbi:alpha-(1-_3)-arabinofuranosyltransferase [Actinocorallia sp. API 0066]|uniref:alpha-(1->3)-arabinofuranosyltransferase domain-containing protein n=1 Tax=Actinocorallia sp. API 0066 TaxID=2896846 RepID=UPI001E2D9C3D|nr:alpha-(1->3)-arabinofuranosyltransferase family protein [Actinocorallia sp. API 0066]MCD0449283.1 alpha-(1->3)-arabinofuranosyltransferase [Actinocorallia sp. API 0066]